MLLSDVVDLHLHESVIEDEEAEEQSRRIFPEGYPVTIALLDTFCDEEKLELVKSALAAGLEVLPPESLLGIISFDDRVRLYDVKGTAPRCRTVTVLEGVPLLAALEDILPLEELLAPVGQHKEMILQTLDLIEATPVPNDGGHTTHAPEEPSFSRTDELPAVRGQAYGTVLQALLQYLKPLGSEKEEKDTKGGVIQCARVFSFVAGPSTMGLGNLQPYITSKEYFRSKETAAAKKELQMAGASVSEFYNQTALVAASLGVVLDLFLLPYQSICLELLSSLASLTGGGIWLYPTTADAMLPQDLFRHLSTLHAHTCLMRIRLPSQLTISKSYGRLMQDSLYEDLYHILTCDPYETFSLDLEHMDELTDPVMIQVAFQYTVPVFSSAAGAPSFELQKRLRVTTLQVGVSSHPVGLYESVKTEVVAKFLMHKVMVAVKAEGILKAAVLLQDWLIILAAFYKKHVPSASLVTSESFQPLIRLVYGLLRSPVLLGGYVHGTDDTQIYLQHLWTSLHPAELHRAIYPTLMSFWSPQDKGLPSHSLSRVAMKFSQAPIFLMDAYHTVLVYYIKDTSLPYPPSPSCRIRQTITELRQSRKRAPQYLTVKEGDTGSQAFVERLLDEPLQLKDPLEGESGVVFQGYLPFVDWIKFASEEYKSNE